MMGEIVSQTTNLAIIYSTVYSDADQRKHQSSASLAFARGIHRGPVNSPHKWPVTRKMFPFDDVIMLLRLLDSPSLEGLSVGNETWPPIGWHHPLVIGWSEYRLGLPCAPLHYGLT